MMHSKLFRTLSLYQKLSFLTSVFKRNYIRFFKKLIKNILLNKDKVD